MAGAQRDCPKEVESAGTRVHGIRVELAANRRKSGITSALIRRGTTLGHPGPVDCRTSVTVAGTSRR